MYTDMPQAKHSAFMVNEKTIWVVTDNTPQPPTDNQRSYRGVPAEGYAQTAVKISVQKLEQEMANFLSMVNQLFNQAEQQANKKSGIQLDEIELSVEISGEGEVKLIGTGAKAAGKGAIKLKFKRAEIT